MHLECLETHQFRNLTGKIFWGKGLNIIHGNNGQGKTNWLEAIYLLARTRSFRTPRLQEAINFGADFASVSGRVSSGTISRDLQVNLRGNTKTISLNGKREPLARYLGQLQVFSFTADELEVIRGVPEARRRFIDRGAASLKPAYLQTISNYVRVIKQKNIILQNAAANELRLEVVEELLIPWNEQLVRLAREIHDVRTTYIGQLNNELSHSLFEPVGLQVRYRSALEDKGDLSDYESLLWTRLKLRMQAEISSGRSLLGPHRDDLELLFGGREMRTYGSSGQQRSALLLLDLAAISLYNSQHGEYPLFLVDDVDAELDENRIRRLLEYLENRTQTFITTSKRSHLREFLSRATVYEIERGEAVSGGPDDEQSAIGMANQ